MPLVLTESDVAAVLRMEDLVPLMERTLAAFSRGEAVQPVRTIVALERHQGFLGSMPAYLTGADAAGPNGGSDALAVKLVAFAPRNAALGIPTHHATILLFDPPTGRLLAILDGRLITEMRTAAVSAASARALARSGASTLALLGSGVQAQSHLEALRVVCGVREVRVWSPTSAHRESFARAHHGPGLDVRAVDRAEDAVRGADLVVTATSSREPVLRGEWLAPGVHVMAVGACRPDWRELDADAVRRARVYVDSLDAARIEAGDLILAERDGAFRWDAVAGEIGAVLAGRARGRDGDDQVTLFKSLGLAVEDVASARAAYEAARARGMGTSVAI